MKLHLLEYNCILYFSNTYTNQLPMKNTTLLLFLTFLFSCSVSNRINWSNSFWATIETDEAYLYKLNSLTSVVDKELKKGTVLYFHRSLGDFYEVYDRNPEKIQREFLSKFRYYLYQPKFKKLTYDYSKGIATIYEIPIPKDRIYLVGERGGCYYMNKHNNRTYVDRSFCSSIAKTTRTKTTKTTYTPKVNRNKTVHVKGHYRTVNGKRVWVKPHTRSKKN